MNQATLILPKSSTTNETRLHGARLSLARALWLAVALLVAAMLWEMVPDNNAVTSNEWSIGETFHGVSTWMRFTTWVRLNVLLESLGAIVAIASGLVIFWRRSDDWVALFISATMLLLSVVFISSNLDMVRVAWLSPQLQAIIQVLFTPLIIFCFLFLFYIFPDGHFVPLWTRTFFWSFAALELVTRVVERNGMVAENLGLAWGISMLGFLVVMPVGAVCQVYRFQRVSSLQQQQQSKWVVVAFALVAFRWLLAATELVIPLDSQYSVLSSLIYLSSIPIQMALPLALAFAVLRYRLWDVDIILNRTLVYGLLTLAILLIYGIVVGGVGYLLGTQNVGWLLPVAATALAALLFHPLRMALQGRVDRMLYGQRGDPLGVLRALGTQLEATLPAERQLQNLAATVAQSLKLPWVGIELELPDAGETRTNAIVAQSAATVPANIPERFPLVFQGEPLGALVVAPRAAGEPLSGDDRRILEGIALQAGPAIQAAQLTVRLQQSRQAIVAAREEERRRLRRDLHDGLGPQLASQTLTIDAILRLQQENPEDARALLLDLKQQSQDAIRDIRRIVYDLRPPALDDLGLVEALRETAARAEQSGIAVTLDAPDTLPPLPAAVESAAYHIAREGLANALRHSAASAIVLRVALQQDALVIAVQDNGKGVPAEVRPGVGLLSMRERAAEVGGTLTIDASMDTGTRITAQLPIVAPKKAIGSND